MDDSLKKIEEFYHEIGLPKIKDFVMAGNLKIFVGIIFNISSIKTTNGSHKYCITYTMIDPFYKPISLEDASCKSNTISHLISSINFSNFITLNYFFNEIPSIFFSLKFGDILIIENAKFEFYNNNRTISCSNDFKNSSVLILSSKLNCLERLKYYKEQKINDLNEYKEKILKKKEKKIKTPTNDDELYNEILSYKKNVAVSSFKVSKDGITNYSLHYNLLKKRNIFKIGSSTSDTSTSQFEEDDKVLLPFFLDSSQWEAFLLVGAKTFNSITKICSILLTSSEDPTSISSFKQIIVLPLGHINYWINYLVPYLDLWSISFSLIHSLSDVNLFPLPIIPKFSPLFSNFSSLDFVVSNLIVNRQKIKFDSKYSLNFANYLTPYSNNLPLEYSQLTPVSMTELFYTHQFRLKPSSEASSHSPLNQETIENSVLPTTIELNFTNTVCLLLDIEYDEETGETSLLLWDGDTRGLFNVPKKIIGLNKKNNSENPLDIEDESEKLKKNNKRGRKNKSNFDDEIKESIEILMKDIEEEKNTENNYLKKLENILRIYEDNLFSDQYKKYYDIIFNNFINTEFILSDSLLNRMFSNLKNLFNENLKDNYEINLENQAFNPSLNHPISLHNSDIETYTSEPLDYKSKVYNSNQYHDYILRFNEFIENFVKSCSNEEIESLFNVDVSIPFKDINKINFEKLFYILTDLFKELYNNLINNRSFLTDLNDFVSNFSSNSNPNEIFYLFPLLSLLSNNALLGTPLHVTLARNEYLDPTFRKLKPGDWIKIKEWNLTDASNLLTKSSSLIKLDPICRDVQLIVQRYFIRLFEIFNYSKNLILESNKQELPSQESYKSMENNFIDIVKGVDQEDKLSLNGSVSFSSNDKNEFGDPFVSLRIINQVTYPAKFAFQGKVIGWYPPQISKFIQRVPSFENLSETEVNTESEITEKTIFLFVLQIQDKFNYSINNLLFSNEDAENFLGVRARDLESELLINSNNLINLIEKGLQNLISSGIVLTGYISCYFVQQKVKLSETEENNYTEELDDLDEIEEKIRNYSKIKWSRRLSAQNINYTLIKEYQSIQTNEVSQIQNPSQDNEIELELVPKTQYILDQSNFSKVNNLKKTKLDIYDVATQTQSQSQVNDQHIEQEEVKQEDKQENIQEVTKFQTETQVEDNNNMEVEEITLLESVSKIKNSLTQTDFDSIPFSSLYYENNLYGQVTTSSSLNITEESPNSSEFKDTTPSSPQKFYESTQLPSQEPINSTQNSEQANEIITSTQIPSDSTQESLSENIDNILETQTMTPFFSETQVESPKKEKYYEEIYVELNDDDYIEEVYNNEVDLIEMDSEEENNKKEYLRSVENYTTTQYSEDIETEINSKIPQILQINNESSIILYDRSYQQNFTNEDEISVEGKKLIDDEVISETASVSANIQNEIENVQTSEIYLKEYEKEFENVKELKELDEKVSDQKESDQKELIENDVVEKVLEDVIEKIDDMADREIGDIEKEDENEEIESNIEDVNIKIHGSNKRKSRQEKNKSKKPKLSPQTSMENTI